MKNIAVLTFLVIMINVNSFAQESERNYSFSLGPQFGFIYGQAAEIVYALPDETKNNLLSELLWDAKPVFYLGVQAQFGRADVMKEWGFFSSVSFKAGIPADSGVMEDRDWFYPSNSDLTCFSSHTNKTNGFFQADAAFGASFPLMSFFYLKPFIAGSWTRFSFTGRNGYGIYNNSNPKEQDFSGEKVISYQQDWLLLAAGFTAGTKILYPFSFEVSLKISPLTYCAAIDTHLLRDTVFRDFSKFGLFVEPSLKMSFTVKRVELSLGALYRNIGKTKGRSYSKDFSNGYSLDKNKAGAGLSMLDTNFLVSFKL